MSKVALKNDPTGFAKPDHLRFNHLPAYAQFLLENRLKEFALALLRVSREVEVPLLKYFESMPEEQLIALSVKGAEDLLTYFSQNRVREFIDKSLQSWLENQLPLVQSDDVVVEDILTIGFARRKVFRDFLIYYSPDLSTFIKVMEEMDRFSVTLEETSYKTLFQMKQEKINEHHHFLDKINNTSPGIIYVFDLLEQKEIYSNHKREDLLGYTDEDLKEMGNRVLPSILHSEDLPLALENVKRFSSARDGEMFTNEYRVKNKRGEFRWHRTYATIFKRTETGIPSQIIGIAIDVNQEKQAASQLEHSENQLREAQEIAGMGSFEWDLVGGNSVFSPQLFKIFEMEGQTDLLAFLDKVHPSDRKKVKEAIEKAKGDGMYECEYRYGTATGEKVIWSRGKVFFQDEKPLKMRGTVMDVTQRHHMLQRLERSEELHKQAQALTHIGNWSWYITENKITWSDEMYRIYGLKPQSEEITFERFISLVHPDDRQQRKQEIERALQTRHAEDYTMRIIPENGPMKILQGKGEVLVDEHNNPYKLLGTCQDITVQALLHEQLRENEATFRQLIANAPDAVIVIDEDSSILLWNPKAEEIFGWTAAEVVGRKLEETIIPAKYRDQHLQGLKRLHETGEARVLNKTIEITACKKNGEEFYIALSIARSLRAGGQVFISFLRDISREKYAELELEIQRNQLAQKNIELERSNQELMAFNYIASHDLKEPVRKIKIFSGLLHEKFGSALPETARDYIGRISASADQMQRLLDALFAFSRATSGEKALVLTDLNALVKEVKTALKESLEEKNAVFTVSALPELPVIPFQFQQMLENMIHNALKYSRSDARPEISLTAAQVPGHSLDLAGALPETTYYAFAVRDNGIGFNQQYAHKIFELFQRLHGKNEYSGTGIGLAICKKIAEHHNGFITARGEPGQGATFTIYIPGPELPAEGPDL